MATFDLSKSISIEFHAEDSIERKMLGLWADDRFKQANVGMRLVNERVVISTGQRIVTEIPFVLFDKLSVKELAEIMIGECNNITNGRGGR